MMNRKKDTSQINSPSDLRTIKDIAIALNRIGAWPLVTAKNNKQTITLKWNLCCFFSLFFIFIFQLRYLIRYVGKKSFFQIGHSYITIVMTTAVMQKITVPWLPGYKQVVKDFLAEIHLFNHKDKSDYAMEIFKRVEKICYLFAIFANIILYMGTILFNITPSYENYKNGMYGSNKPENGSFVAPLYMLFPFDTETDFKGHLFVVILSWGCTWVVASVFGLSNLLLSIIVFHIWGNLKILKHSLDNFPKPANHMVEGEISWYTEEESKRVSVLIVDLINHHRIIKIFMAKISSVYSVFLFMSYACYEIVGCIALLECSDLDSEAMGNYGHIVLLIFEQLIQISVIFELIGSQSEKLFDSVYGLPWECMDTKSRKLVIFFLQNVQEPISLKACGMVSVGVQTMAAIIKACFSYFLMLRTVASTEEI